MPTAQVLWLTEHHPPSRGGMAQSSDRITRNLRAAGVLVDIVQLTRAVDTPSRTLGFGGARLVQPLGEDPEHGLATAWLAIDRHRRESGRRYTHVVAFGGLWSLTAGPVVARWLDAALFTLLRGIDFDTGIWSIRRRGVLNEALQASECVVTVATETAERVAALYPRQRVECVFNSIDLSGWQPLASDRARAEEWVHSRVAPERRVLGLIGQLKPKKGALDLLRAVRNSPAADRFHPLLVGDLDPAVAQWLAGVELPHDRLSFLDRDQLAWVYAACDLVALPSLHDGMPNVALEAAALGCPLLASDAGGLGDLAAAGAVAFGFPAGDWDSCARVLTDAAECDEAELRAYGERARQVIGESFTPARETEGYLRVLGVDSD